MAKAVLFDVDGTLLDTTEYIFQAFEHTLKKYNITPPDRKILATYIGRTLPDIYQDLAPKVNFDLLFDSHNGFQLQNLHLVKIFLDVKETISKLHQDQVKMAAVTSRSRENVLITLEQAGLKKYFEVVMAREDTEKHKPDPEPLFKAMEHLNVQPEQTYMVGDAEPDILAGKNAGVKTVGVTYGFGGKDIAKYEPDYLIDQISELPGILLSS